jgi:hypothetical protein
MDGGKSMSRIKWATTSSHFFTLPFDVSLSEQMRNREEWRLIVQEARAHPEL